MVRPRATANERYGDRSPWLKVGVRLFTTRRAHEERLLWSRDIRFTDRVARALPGARVLELEAGSCVIAPAHALTEQLVADIARAARNPEYGLVGVDPDVPERERYLLAFSAAVQVAGIADRIGMAQSTHVAMTKTLDYFFVVRNNHEVNYQPIVNLATGDVHEYECLFRPMMPMLPQSIASIVHAAIATDRPVELDTFIVSRILSRSHELDEQRTANGLAPMRLAINLAPETLLAPALEPNAFAEACREAGFLPSRITLECTEQQAVPDVVPLQKRVKALRRLGFGFAVDDAGAGHASFTLIASIRPSVIKIDREIVHGIGSKSGDAKQALVEAFVSFGRRIGARLVAEGIENRRDLATLRSLGVELGQGYLIGRPSAVPQPPRSLDTAGSRRTRASAMDETRDRLNPARLSPGRVIRAARPGH